MASIRTKHWCKRVDYEETNTLLDGIRVVLHRRVMQSRHSVRDPSIDVGAELDEGRQDVRVVERSRHDDRADKTQFASLVNVRPSLLDEQASHGVEAVPHGPIERRGAFVVFHVRVGTQLYQLAHCILETGRDVRVERSGEFYVNIMLRTGHVWRTTYILNKIYYRIYIYIY